MDYRCNVCTESIGALRYIDFGAAAIIARYNEFRNNIIGNNDDGWLFRNDEDSAIVNVVCIKCIRNCMQFLMMMMTGLGSHMELTITTGIYC